MLALQQPSIRIALGGLMALAVGMGIGRFVYTPILPVMAEELGLTKSATGLIASANFAGYLCGAVLATLPFLGGSRRAWLLGALTVNALAMGLMAAGSALAGFLVLRFIGGVASAFILVFASALVLDRLAAAGRGDLSSVHFAGVGTGIASSAILVTALMTIGADWRALWFGSAAVSALAVAVVAWLVPGDGPGLSTAQAPASPASADRASNKRKLAALTLAYGLFGFGYVITATFLVDIVRGSPNVASLEAVIWVIVGLAGAPSVALWMAIGRRIGMLQAFALASLLEAAGVTASVLLVTIPGLIFSAVLLGGTFMGITALGFVAARQFTTGDQRASIAIMTAGFSVGQIIGPAFAGFVFERTGSFVLPSLAAATALGIAAVTVLLIRRPRASPSRTGTAGFTSGREPHPR